MSSRQIPFFANRNDNMSCMLACIRSALEYLTKKSYSWEELEALTGFIPGKAAWTVQAWTKLQDNDIEIRMIENFDYRRYQMEGQSYLEDYFTPDELRWQLANTNIAEIKPLLPLFFERVTYIQKSPQLSDIDTMLAEHYLVTVQLNANTLNDQDGYVAHMILVYDKSGNDYIAHDPGLPPQKSRRISAEKLFRAMGGQGNSVEVTGLRRKGAHGKP